LNNRPNSTESKVKGILRSFYNLIQKKLGNKRYVISSSEFVAKNTLSSAFEITLDNCLNFGYPRNVVFGMSKEEILDHYKMLSFPSSIDNFQRCISSGKNLVLWLPTYRDAGYDFIDKSGVKHADLARYAEDNNLIFILKLHYATSCDNIHFLNERYRSSLLIIDNNEDVMPWLGVADILISDYSSVMFDFVITRKPIIRFVFDENEYLSSRHFYPIVLKNLPGKKVEKMPQLFDEVRSIISNDFNQNYPDSLVTLYNSSLAVGSYPKNILHFVTDTKV
jgi:CDP-glycerol glycerophosphotransferase (TagB/SpsB family)